MTQLETGKLQLMPKVTKPIELIEYAVGATRVLAERFGCFVEVEYPEKISKLFVDSEKIAWVITNLLSNAIHHSPEGSRIIVGAAEHDKTVDIYVQDFGRGIDPRYHKSYRSTATSACPARRYRAAGWASRSRKSSSKRTAVRSALKAK